MGFVIVQFGGELVFAEAEELAQDWLDEQVKEETESLRADLQRAQEERDGYRKAAAQMHNGLVGHMRAGAFNAELADDGIRLFDEAEAFCGRGFADDIAEIQSYKGKLEAAERACEDTRKELAEEFARAEKLENHLVAAQMKHAGATLLKEQAEADAASLRTALAQARTYMQHKPECGLDHSKGWPPIRTGGCSCGFDAVRDHPGSPTAGEKP